MILFTEEQLKSIAAIVAKYRQRMPGCGFTVIPPLPLDAQFLKERSSREYYDYMKRADEEIMRMLREQPQPEKSDADTKADQS